MPRPIETLLSLPRVRLIDRVPIVETQAYVRHLVQRAEYRHRLVNQAIRVSDGSAEHFANDDKGLSALLQEVDSAEYIVTHRSKRVMGEMLNGICADGSLFKGFENTIQPLCEISPNLRQASTVADTLADRAKEESIDLARALLLPLPTKEDKARQTAARKLTKPARRLAVPNCFLFGAYRLDLCGRGLASECESIQSSARPWSSSPHLGLGEDCLVYDGGFPSLKAHPEGRLRGKPGPNPGGRTNPPTHTHHRVLQT